MTSEVFDPLDREIVQRLTIDARVSSRRIAAELGINDGTVRRRIARLESSGLLEFRVVADDHAPDTPTVAMIGIHAVPAKTLELATLIAEVPGIRFVARLLGRYDLAATGYFASLAELDETIRQRIRPLAGVVETEAVLFIEGVRYDAADQPIAPKPRGTAAPSGLTRPSPLPS